MQTVGCDACEMDPQNAIIQWFRYTEKYPTCVDILAETEEDAKELLKWADNNPEKLKVWSLEYKCPYRDGWLSDQIKRQLIGKKKFLQWGYDAVFPFCMGG